MLEFSDLKNIIHLFWVAFGASALLSYPVYKLLLAMNARQTVSAHLGESHQKKQGTPTMGGLMILVGVLTAFGFSHNWSLFGLTFGFGLIGFADDYLIPKFRPGSRGLRWIPKLILQFVVAIIFLSTVFPETESANLFWRFSFMFFWSIWLLFFVNAYNFADGLDLLASGLLVIIAFCLILLVAPFGESAIPIWEISVILLGSVIPFMFFNAPPAKVFMGDLGSLPLGGLIGASFIYCWTEVGDTLTGNYGREFKFALFVLSMILVLELILVPIQIGCVKLFKKRLPIRTPIHHTFEYWGWPESRILWSFLLVQFLLAALAITLVYISGIPPW